MPKRVSMKGRGLEAVYGAFEAAPVRRRASTEAYLQPGTPDRMRCYLPDTWNKPAPYRSDSLLRHRGQCSRR